jgi:hypothetical protein
MDIGQVIWGINTTLLGIMLFLYRSLREDVKSMKGEIEKRTLILTCDKMHQEIAKSLHVHGSLGNAGEVIQK